MSELNQPQKLHNLSFADLDSMREMLLVWKVRFADRPQDSMERIDSAIDILTREITARIEYVFPELDFIPDNYSYMKNDNPELGEVLNEKK